MVIVILKQIKKHGRSFLSSQDEPYIRQSSFAPQIFSGISIAMTTSPFEISYIYAIYIISYYHDMM